MGNGGAAALVSSADGLRADGRYEEAITAYQEAIRLDASYAPYRFSIAELCFELQRYAEAAQVYAALVQGEPHHAQAWAGLGRSAHLLGEDQHAVAALEQAILLAPHWAEPLYEAAVIYASQDADALAEDRLRRALHADPRLESAAEEEGLLARYPMAR